MSDSEMGLHETTRRELQRKLDEHPRLVARVAELELAVASAFATLEDASKEPLASAEEASNILESALPSLLPGTQKRTTDSVGQVQAAEKPSEAVRRIANEAERKSRSLTPEQEAEAERFGDSLIDGARGSSDARIQPLRACTECGAGPGSPCLGSSGLIHTSRLKDERRSNDALLVCAICDEPVPDDGGLSLADPNVRYCSRACAGRAHVRARRTNDVAFKPLRACAECGAGPGSPCLGSAGLVHTSRLKVEPDLDNAVSVGQPVETGPGNHQWEARSSTWGFRALGPMRTSLEEARADLPRAYAQRDLSALLVQVEAENARLKSELDALDARTDYPRVDQRVKAKGLMGRGRILAVRTQIRIFSELSEETFWTDADLYEVVENDTRSDSPKVSIDG